MVDESQNHKVEVFDWEGQGFRPLVEFGSWLVALMNWEPRFDPTGVGDVERHNETDEVFVLTRGRSLLFIANGDDIQVLDMQPGIIYNVTKGAWHSVIGTKETTWLIVESNKTSSENTDHRHLTTNELDALRNQYPSWLNKAPSGSK
jgi:mannose-6-phosphate isomerase-like protein (cupin superfamily)